MVMTCAASWSRTLSSIGGESSAEMLTVLVAGSVVATLNVPVRSMSLGSKGGTTSTFHT